VSHLRFFVETLVFGFAFFAGYAINNNFVSQSACLLISRISEVLVDLAILEFFTNRHILHLMHFFMPGTILLGLWVVRGGTLLLISLFRIFSGLLWATKGGRVKTSLSWVHLS
jgi:hypothetical protein